MNDILESFIVFLIYMISCSFWFRHIRKNLKQVDKTDKVIVGYMYFIITLMLCPIILVLATILVRIIEGVIS